MKKNILNTYLLHHRATIVLIRLSDSPNIARKELRHVGPAALWPSEIKTEEGPAAFINKRNTSSARGPRLH